MMRAWRALGAGVAAAVLASCVSATSSPTPPHDVSAPATEPGPAGGARLVLIFGGDTMLGRGVASRVDAAPATVFAGVRAQIVGADLAAANLESPLTRRPHAVTNPNVLEADPSAAQVLADAGFDAMDIANNHAGDAGPATAGDTARALHAAGIAPIGEAAPGGFPEPTIVSLRGVRVALLGFDASREGSAPTQAVAGVARWTPAAARTAIRRAARSADVVTVALHGGDAFGLAPDPYLARLARVAGRWGADIVWCDGPHTIQAVGTLDPDHDGRPTVVATSLGNLLFDGGPSGPPRGALLEVWAGADGVTAYRAGLTTYGGGRVRFLRWLPLRHPG
jgi:poly-gamma-glutamate capsule biosynthesis protein CapA/YwtB (metallophosphatase superfamily)